HCLWLVIRAALSLARNTRQLGERTVLIVHLGSTNVDVSIVSINEGICNVKTTVGNANLGGDDFTYRLMDVCGAELTKNHNKDLFSDPLSLNRLRFKSEDVKKEMASSQPYIHTSVTKSLDAVLNSNSARDKFKALSADCYQSIMDIAENCLRDAKMEKHQIDEIVCVGGSEDADHLKHMLSDYFPGKKLQSSSILGGACIKAAILSGETQEMTLQEISNRSIRIEIDGRMHFIFERNTELPARAVKMFNMDNQSTVIVKVFEGENDDPHNLLGVLEPPIPTGKTEIEVTFELDIHGILSVYVKDSTTGHQNKIPLTYHKKRLTREEIDKMAANEEKMKVDDLEQKKREKALSSLRVFVGIIKMHLSESRIPNDERKAIDTKIYRIKRWLKMNEDFKSTPQVPEINRLKKELGDMSLQDESEKSPQETPLPGVNHSFRPASLLNKYTLIS
ncbi:hypothetical protein PFISCL1PPCAC_21879, partial [Pristionchus fissidentatus]